MVVRQQRSALPCGGNAGFDILAVEKSNKLTGFEVLVSADADQGPLPLLPHHDGRLTHRIETCCPVLLEDGGVAHVGFDDDSAPASATVFDRAEAEVDDLGHDPVRESAHPVTVGWGDE